jgi:hypothetical protein
LAAWITVVPWGTSSCLPSMTHLGIRPLPNATTETRRHREPRRTDGKGGRAVW